MFQKLVLLNLIYRKPELKAVSKARPHWLFLAGLVWSDGRLDKAVVSQCCHLSLVLVQTMLSLFFSNSEVLICCYVTLVSVSMCVVITQFEL